MTCSSKASRSRYSSTVRPGARPCDCDAALEARLGARAQLGRLVDRRAVADREARQDRLCGARPERAALGDLDRRGERLRQVGEQRGHLGAALEIVLGGELAAVGLGDHAALGDADQRVVGLVVLAPARSNGSLVATSGMPLGVGELDQRRLGRALGRACRGAATRCRAGRRTAAAASRSARRQDRPARRRSRHRAGRPARR